MLNLGSLKRPDNVWSIFTFSVLPKNGWLRAQGIVPKRETFVIVKI